MHQAGWIDKETYQQSDSLEVFDFRVPAAFKLKTSEHEEISRQFVPDLKEFNIKSNELEDPIGDGTHSPCEG